MWQTRSFVVAGNDEDRHPPIREMPKWFVRAMCDGRRNDGPIEYVAGVHDDVDISRECRFEGSTVVGEEVVPATPTLDSRTHRQVEAEVRVCQEKNPKVCAHPQKLRMPVFVR
jgi:hypothetical protein